MSAATATTIRLRALPEDLRAEPRWVVWKLEQRDGKPTKVPYRADGQDRASSTDPATWSTFEKALDTFAVGEADGVGFVLGNGWAGIDLDDLFNANGDVIDGYLMPDALTWVTRLRSYTERSPSREGLHVVGRGELPDWSRNTKKVPGKEGKIEVYDTARFFTVTGDVFQGLDTVRELELLPDFLEAAGLRRPEPATNENIACIPVDLDDRELFERAFAAKNGADFRDLWDGRWQDRYGSQSEADLALCSRLAFWTGRDPARIDDLFRLSGLYRDKWARDDYREATIERAIAGCTDIYNPRPDQARADAEIASAFAQARGKRGAADDAELRSSAPPADVKRNGIPTTDLGNAERLVIEHGHDLRFAPGLGWLAWDGRRWKPDRDGEAIRRAKLTVRSMLSAAGALEDATARKNLANHALRSESEARLRAAVSLASTERAVIVPADEIDAHPLLFNAANGTIDLRTGELREHRREDMLARITSAVYNPDARSDLWESSLERATGGDEELSGFLQRAVGYSLTGHTDEDRLFFVHGPTATAKSSLLEAIKSTLGEYAVVADFDSFLKRRGDAGIRNDIARLDGARLVMSIEVDEGKTLAEGLLKMITGGDTVTARFLYRETFEFRPRFKLWLCANERPRVNAHDAAMWRRILQVPFVCVIPEAERDERVRIKLRTDPDVQAAILAWAVQGCLAWQQQGLNVPQAVLDYTSDYRAENDPLRDWLADCCEPDPDAWTSFADLRQSYETWCEQNGEKHVTTRKLGTLLKARGYPDDRAADGTRGRKGLRVR